MHPKLSQQAAGDSVSLETANSVIAERVSSSRGWISQRNAPPGTEIHHMLRARQGEDWQNPREFTGEVDRVAWQGADAQFKLQQSSLAEAGGNNY